MLCFYGALVQLVRMPACHAGGHGFESRTHRNVEMAELVNAQNCKFCIARYPEFESQSPLCCSLSSVGDNFPVVQGIEPQISNLIIPVRIWTGKLFLTE